MAKQEDTTLSDKARQSAVKEALEQIRDRFGDGSIMKLGEAKKMNVEVISSGCLSIDIALGVGGFPRGRVIEIYGPESSGKTTLAQHAIAEIQKRGGLAAFVDAEHALDPEYARKIGININDLFISQPDNGEQALEIVETLVRSNAIDIIVVDSAHGFSKNVIEATIFIKKNYPVVQVISGNIATSEGAKALILAGADGLRVGMGPGFGSLAEPLHGIKEKGTP